MLKRDSELVSCISQNRRERKEEGRDTQREGYLGPRSWALGGLLEEGKDEVKAVPPGSLVLCTRAGRKIRHVYKKGRDLPLA